MPEQLTREFMISELKKRANKRLELIKNAQTDSLAHIQFMMPDFKAGRHNRLICDKLNDVATGKTKRLIVNCPPRHGKSLTISKHFPAFYLGNNPRKQAIAVSYGAVLAQSFGRDVRNLISDPQHKILFPNCDISDDSAAKNIWHTKQGGVYIAAGVGGAITGRGGDIIIIDDPVKSRAEAESPTVRDKIWNWYRADLRTRLMPNGAIILLQTRWHPYDLTGMLLDEMHSGGEQWEVVDLPALCDKPNDPLNRKLGEALWPEWFDEKTLLNTKNSIGEREFSALYQQNPQTGSEFFSASQFLINGTDPVEHVNLPYYVFCTIDTTMKGGKGNDGTAVSYYAYQDLELPDQYPLTLLDWDIVEYEGALLETWIPQVYSRLEELAKETKARSGSIGAFVEDKATGTILLQQAPRNNWQMHPIDSKLTAAGKDARAINAATYIQQGKVKISRYALEKQIPYRDKIKNHWMHQMSIYRVGTSGEGREDDLFDSATYGIAIALGNNEGV